MKTAVLHHFMMRDGLDAVLLDDTIAPAADPLVKLGRSLHSRLLAREYGPGDRSAPVLWLAQRREKPSVFPGLDARFPLARVTVEVPAASAPKWSPWAKSAGASDEAIEKLHGDSRGSSKRWHVSLRAVPRSAWLEISDADTGALFWRKPDTNVDHSETLKKMFAEADALPDEVRAAILGNGNTSAP